MAQAPDAGSSHLAAQTTHPATLTGNVRAQARSLPLTGARRVQASSAALTGPSTPIFFCTS